MDSMAAQAGMGPATGPLTVIRKVRRRRLADLPTDRTLVMGILNVTHNSFSDGGDYLDTETAIEQGLRLHYSGADLIDVGGESTRPGAEPIDPLTEQNRVLPVIEALLKAGAVVSVDTMHTATAEAALKLGDVIVNDVSGLNHEPDMPELIARTGAPYVLMHNRGDAQTMDSLAVYEDVVEEVIQELTRLKDTFLAAGVKPEQLILDPGLGFAKTADHNWEMITDGAAVRFRNVNSGKVLGVENMSTADNARGLARGLIYTRDGKLAPPGAAPGSVEEMRHLPFIAKNADAQVGRIVDAPASHAQAVSGRGSSPVSTRRTSRRQRSPTPRRQCLPSRPQSARWAWNPV